MNILRPLSPHLTISKLTPIARRYMYSFLLLTTLVIFMYFLFNYYLVLVDDFTKFTWIFLLKLKSDFLFTFKHFVDTIENLLDRIIKILRSE